MMMSQQYLTSQEIYLIENSTHLLSQDINLSTSQISQAILEQLGINRNQQLIKIYLKKRCQSLITNVNNRQANNQQMPNANLFKSFSDHSNIVFPPTIAKPTLQKNNYYFNSKRKVIKQQIGQSRSCWTLQERLDEIQRINQQCNYTYDKYDRKSSRKASFKEQNGISINILWFYSQFFYSNYDKKYFQNNPLKDVYNQLNFKPEQITARTHRLILKALPKPKLFNDQFLAFQKAKLQQFRNSCRQNTKNLSRSNQSATQFPVHSIVLALHPSCGHLHTGSIMAYYKQNLYMVRFLKPQLPAHKILDVNMSTQFTNFSNKMQNRNQLGDRNQSLSNQNTQGDIIEKINFEMTGYLIKVLAYKSQLVKILRIINDKVDRKQNVAPVRENPNKFKDILEWVVTIIKNLDLIIQQAIIRFRLRGVNEGNSSTFFGNLKSLLLNPLKLMSKDFQNSSEQPDINAAQQIKQIINKQKQNQIKKAINNAIIFSNESNISQNINLNRKQLQTKITPLIYSCLGILADLKHEGKDFDIENNSNLLKLADISGKENSETFNQVYERLYSIVNKVRE